MPSVSDPLQLLVARHQIHRCNVRYCQKGNPLNPCQFNFPKPISKVSEFDKDDHAIYARGAEDVLVNPYNPYLLALFETDMDIQINQGPAALHYLAKYLTKMQDDIEFQLVATGNQDVFVGYHMKSKIFGSIEAAFDILGLHNWHKMIFVVFVQT